jgi:hypothetical protein
MVWKHVSYAGHAVLNGAQSLHQRCDLLVLCWIHDIQVIECLIPESC